MNKIAPWLSILSLALVGVLYYLHFSKNEKPTGTSKETAHVENSPEHFKMAYFEMDSLEKNYEYVKEIREMLRKKEENNQRQLNNMKSGFQKKIAAWQQKGVNISQAESEAMNREYQEMQMTYDSREKQLFDELKAESQKRLMDVNKKIADFLKEYNKTKGYTYIITNEESLIYYKDSVYNITKDVVDGLNALYKAKKKN